MKKKLCALVLCALLFVACFAGCGAGVPEVSSSTPLSATVSVPEAPAAGAEIAMLAPDEVADSDYGQALWSTVSRVAGEAAVTSGIYRAGTGDEKTALASLELAVKGGAQLVVLEGAALADMAVQAQNFYPDVDFILLDMPYDTTVRPNGMLVRYSPEQGGWLAGYATVYEELGNIGFTPGGGEEAERYLLGFLLGADAAAQDRKAEEGSLRAYPIELTGGQREWEAQFYSFYLQDGPAMRAYFASRPEYTEDALLAAKDTGGYVSGIEPMPGDVANENILVVVTHDPQSLLSVLITSWTEGRFSGGEVVEGTVGGGEIGLSLPKEGLGRFDERRYQTVLDRFRIGNLATQIALATTGGDGDTRRAPEELNLTAFIVGPPIEEDSPPQAVSGSGPGSALGNTPVESVAEAMPQAQAPSPEEPVTTPHSGEAAPAQQEGQAVNSEV